MNRNIPEKPFNVVFKRNTPLTDDDNISEDRVLLRKKMGKNAPKSPIKVMHIRSASSIEDFFAHDELIQKPHEKVLKLNKNQYSVEKSIENESSVTDKFVHDIESLLSIVNDNIGKLQTTYENILKKLPKLEPNQ